VPDEPSFEYDLFISYRRKDGQPFARWLRDNLIRYHLPRSFEERSKVRLRVYKDTEYERATDDFWQNTILPALLKSKYLGVVATPGALEPRADGQPNWLEREIAAFASAPQGKNVLVVRGIGSMDDHLPGGLSEKYPRIEQVDLRGLQPVWRRFSRANQLRDALLTVVAELYGVQPEEMPSLRQAEERRKRRVAWAVAVVSTLLLAVVSGLALAFLNQRNEALHQRGIAEQRGAEARDQRDEANRRLADLFALEATRAREERNHLAARVYVAAARERFPTTRALVEGLAASQEPVTFLRDLNSASDSQTAPVFSPVADLLAVGGADGFVRILDSRNWRQRARFGPHHAPVTSLAFSGDGRVLAVGLARPRQRGSEQTPVTVQLWDVRRRARGARLQSPLKYSADVRGVAVNQDGSWVAAAAEQLFVWDGVRGTIRFQEGTKGAVRVAFNREGSLLAVSTWSGQVDVLRFPAFSTLFQIPPRPPFPPDVLAIPGLAFSPEGDVLVVGSYGGRVTRWRIPARQQASILAGHKPGVKVNDASYSPDGRFLATGGSDGTVLLWDVCHEEVLTQLDAHISPVFSVAFDRRGLQLVSTELDLHGDPENQRWFGQSRVWQIHPNVIASPTAGITSDILRLLFGRDGRVMLVKLLNGRKINFAEPGSTTARPVWPVPTGWEALAADVSRGGKRLAVGLQRGLNARVDVIDLADRTTSVSLPVPFHPLGIASVALSPDGSRVIVGTGEVIVWEVQTGKELLRVSAGRGDPVQVAFGPGAADVAWTEPGQVTLYNLTSKQRREFSFHKPPPPHAIALSGDGRLLAASFSDRSIIVWDLSSKAVSSTLSFGAACYPLSPDGLRRESTAEIGARLVALNGDGSRLAGLVGDQVKVWGEDVPTSLSQAVRESGSCWTDVELTKCRETDSNPR
jgi:WD40 repeat protein